MAEDGVAFRTNALYWTPAMPRLWRNASFRHLIAIGLTAEPQP
jgi:hypothetical protein